MSRISCQLKARTTETKIDYMQENLKSKVLNLKVKNLLELSWRQTLSNTIILCLNEIICLTETWHVSVISDDVLFLPQFSILRIDSKTTTTKATKHGGVLIAMKHLMPFVNGNIELSDYLISQIQTPNPFLLGCLYSAPTKQHISPVKDFLISFDFERLNHLSPSLICPSVFITGDNNFIAATWPIMQSTDAKEQIRLDLMTDFNYNQHILT